MKEQYILLEDIENLGKAGELVYATAGYARNFLIPKKLALKASKGAMRQFESRREKIEEKRKEEIGRAQELANKLIALEIAIPVNVGEDNKLFGSVTPHTLAEAIIAKGFEIDHHKLHLSSIIKELGEYEAKVKFHPEVSVVLKFSVVKAK